MEQQQSDLIKNKLFKKTCWQCVLFFVILISFFIYYIVKDEIIESDEKYAI